MPHVISASRRTDIPAFYTQWLVRRLRAKSVHVRNPYSGRSSRVSLAPGDVAALVFWSKNYAPLLPRLEEVEQTTKNLFFHFTITGNRDMEPGVPDPRDAIGDYRFLSRRFLPERVVWRFDPICITDKLSYEVHEERFLRCAEQLRGAVKRCIISFVHPYKKVLANMARQTDHTLADLSLLQKRQYAVRLAAQAEHFGIRLFACCNDYLLCDAIGKSACIDGRYLSVLFQSALDTRPASIREQCACTRSVDIGAYDTCAHGCLYCYANADGERAGTAPSRHDPSWNALNSRVEEESGVAEGAKNAVSIKMGPEPSMCRGETRV